jgi:hypothetical protein
VTIVRLVNYLETVETNKTLDADLTHRAVTEMVKSNSVNNNAINAKPVLVDRDL